MINSETGEIELVTKKDFNEDLGMEEMGQPYPDPYDPNNFLASAEDIAEFEDMNTNELVHSMVAQSQDDFDPNEYKEEAIEEEEAINGQSSDENHEEFVKGLQREISSE